MAKRKRNYKQEYRRRKARGKRLGLSRAAARGPCTCGRTDTSGRNRQRIRTDPEKSGLKMMKGGASLKAAAHANRISQERLRRYLRENTDATRSGKIWRIVDLRRFRLPIYSQAQIVEVWLSAEQATKAGQYLGAVGRFLPTGNASVLKPFVGDGVRDIAGKFHLFETRENVIYIGSTPPGSCRCPKFTRSKDEGAPWRTLNASSNAPGFDPDGTQGLQTQRPSIQQKRSVAPRMFGER